MDRTFCRLQLACLFPKLSRWVNCTKIRKKKKKEYHNKCFIRERRWGHKQGKVGGGWGMQGMMVAWKMKVFYCSLVQPTFLLLSKLNRENERKHYLYHQLGSLHSCDYNPSRTLKNTNYAVSGCLSHFMSFMDVFLHKNETTVPIWATVPAKAIKEYIYIDIDFSLFS